MIRAYRSIIIKKMIFPIADYAMKTSISEYLRGIETMRKLSKEEIVEWQNEGIKQIIHHAYYQTEYYNNLFNNHNIKPDEINTIQDLSKIPILTKLEIRKNFNALIPKNISTIPHKKAATGGSSGDPMIYLLDNNSWSFSNANSILNWERAGYFYGEKYIALGSSSLYVDKKPSLKHKLYYKLKNKIGLNGINMSPDVCNEYLKVIRKNKIKFLYGYASSIYLLAKWTEETNEKLNLKCCFTTSEVLTDQYRKVISSAFQCEIVDCYGAHDGGITAFAHTEGYFEVNYNSLVRIENTDNNNFGSILLTDLFNYAMPLINYKLGDEVLLNDQEGDEYFYNGQIIEKVVGRSTDIIHLKNGSTLTGPGFTILFKDIPVEYYCIEKTAENSIICWIIKLPDFEPHHEKLIMQVLKKQAGEEVNIKISNISMPFLSKSGKRLYMIDNTQKL